MGEIPKLAHEQGLAVIMGIWDPKNRDEVALRSRRRSTCSEYSIGQDRLDGPYSLETLAETVDYVRRMTGLPVTTTEEAKNYDEPDEPRLLPVSDWLFPDVHLLRLMPMVAPSTIWYCEKA